MEKMALDARNAAVISVLEQHGLTSVETRDLDTVVSYEGAVIMPVAVTKTDCAENRDGACTITARVLFSPISFPDRWPEQQFRFKIRRFFKDLFSVFD